MRKTVLILAILLVGAQAFLHAAPGQKYFVDPVAGDDANPADNPVVIKFLPSVHSFGIKNVQMKQLYISNSIDSTEPIPVGIIMSGVKHFRLQGGGVDGAGMISQWRQWPEGWLPISFPGWQSRDGWHP